jgi:hypothetical protein
MARKGGCQWYHSIGLYFVNISANFKNYLKDPRPLNSQKCFWVVKQLYVGRNRIKELAGLKTGKKQNSGAPYLLVLHNSDCRHLQGKVFLCHPCSPSEKKTAKLNGHWTVYTGEGWDWKIRQHILTKNQRNFEHHTLIVLNCDNKNPGTPKHKFNNFNKI